MTYNGDDIIQMHLNDPVLKRVINILCNTGDGCCPTSWPRELKRYRNKIVLKNGILKYNHYGKYLKIIPGELTEDILRYGHSEWFSGHLSVDKTH